MTAVVTAGVTIFGSLAAMAVIGDEFSPGIVLVCVVLGLYICAVGSHRKNRMILAGGVFALCVDALLVFDPQFFPHLGIALILLPCIVLGVLHYRHERHRKTTPSGDVEHHILDQNAKT